MVTKTFKADSALETLRLVQAELGANAIVVSMREVPGGPAWNPWKSSAVEIVAALPEAATPPAAPQKSASVLRPSERGVGVEFVEEVPEIEWELAPEPKPAAPRSQPPARPKPRAGTAPADTFVPASLKQVREQLMQQGVDEHLVDSLVSLAIETLSPGTLADLEATRKNIVQLMAAELRVLPSAGQYVSGQVICLVGASGSGKTSAAAKLALLFGQKRKKITWVCADTLRSGAVAEARAYADALGLELRLVYVPGDLRGLLEGSQPDELFLVDTPGYNPCSEGQMAELGALLSELPHRSTYLAASATTRESDLLQLAASLGVFRLDALILTRLDETHSFGSLYNFARNYQIPLAYFSSGRDAARDFEAADALRLVAALFGKEWNR